ncbi:hypothetical protein LTR36_001165 [Oleoguttula mirabilis]|uniref:Uncharacterized protein n=1 Tax=Oleoguttula mirabilis TaxID=1507867 RepID=A0AAV9J2W6_9PEZI|nr:hypothetical protein LTR36_001165 [Oleoguttula mirabilis]
MLSLDQILLAFANDWFALAGPFLFVLLLVVCVLVLTVFARRSGNEIHDQVLIPVRSSEQRQYWITRRRQRFVAAYGDYPDMFGEGTLLGEAAKHRRAHAARAKLESSRNHIDGSPAKRKGPYLPVFAPKMSDDDLFKEIGRLEAQSEVSLTTSLERVASQRSLEGRNGSWWKMFDNSTSERRAIGSRRSPGLRQKSRSSLGTLTSLLEATEEDNEMHLMPGHASSAQLATTSSEVDASRAQSERSWSIMGDGEAKEYEMQTLTREPSVIAVSRGGIAGTEPADAQEQLITVVGTRAGTDEELLHPMAVSAFSRTGDGGEEPEASVLKMPPVLEPRTDESTNKEGLLLRHFAGIPGSGEGQELSTKAPGQILRQEGRWGKEELRRTERAFSRPSILGLEYE